MTSTRNTVARTSAFLSNADRYCYVVFCLCSPRRKGSFPNAFGLFSLVQPRPRGLLQNTLAKVFILRLDNQGKFDHVDGFGRGLKKESKQTDKRCSREEGRPILWTLTPLHLLKSAHRVTFAGGIQA